MLILKHEELAKIPVSTWLTESILLHVCTWIMFSLFFLGFALVLTTNTDKDTTISSPTGSNATGKQPNNSDSDLYSGPEVVLEAPCPKRAINKIPMKVSKSKLPQFESDSDTSTSMMVKRKRSIQLCLSCTHCIQELYPTFIRGYLILVFGAKNMSVNNTVRP
jgi:hypothetical protein